ncbi:hypothetical protein HPB50_021658 [Hyalomma asiaticum]|uniref:Uncharacterized protein n=1 Tax=Hyalomma asiaticum TaxID=266040 RepID=A0ACB7T8D7_HYAAI|nr:hypothetical protein HPB50_021658 [Hyalomma asiaticum]
MRQGDDDKVDEATDDCEGLLAEVPKRQGEAVEHVNVDTFRNVDGEITLPELSDCDTVTAVGPCQASSESEDDNDDTEVDSGTSSSEVAGPLTVM